MPPNLPPLRIGPVAVEFPVALAPMAGYTDSAFRSVCRDHHCGLVYTELTNAQALVHGSKTTFFLLEADPAERPLGAHIYGSDPALLAEAAALIGNLNRFDLIDINCGCPMRKVMRRGAGAGLMNHPEKVHAIVRAVRQAVSLPVTIKMRLGVSPKRPTGAEVAQAAEEAGAAALAIHARFAVDKHKGPPDWAALAAIKAARKIPVIGNGGIFGAEDAARMIAETGVDGVMVGRGALGNPWVFAEIHAWAAGLPWHPPSSEDLRAAIMEHFSRLLRLKTRDPRYGTGTHRPPRHTPEAGAALLFRAHLLKYLAGFEGCGAIRAGMSSVASADDIRRAADTVLGPPPGSPSHQDGGRAGQTG